MYIGVSACLLGVNCKYSGKNNRNENVLRLAEKHTLIPVCPEQLGGLPTPRYPSEICGGRVINNIGEDVTAYYEKGAGEALNIAKLFGCERAVLKARSPECGSKEIYDGTFTKTVIPGKGITAALLEENGIEVYDETDEFLR